MKVTCSHCGRMQVTRVKDRLLSFICKTCNLTSNDYPHNEKDHFKS